MWGGGGGGEDTVADFLVGWHKPEPTGGEGGPPNMR